MIEELVSIISGVASIVLGIIVYRRNPRSATNLLLAGFSFANALLTLVNYLALYQLEKTGELFWARFDMGIAVLHSAVLFLLMYNFPQVHFRMHRKMFIPFIIVVLATFTLAVSPLVFTTTKINETGQVVPVPGVGIAVFGIVVFGMGGLGIARLFRQRLRVKGINRMQYNYIIGGIVLTLTLIVAINFANFLLRADASLNIYLPLFLLPFVGATAYAIIRHRLLDIRAAIFKSLSFSALIGAFALIYGAILILAVPPLARILNISPAVISAAGALLAVLLARYMQSGLRKITDRFLFQQQVDYRKALVTVGKELSGTININDVTSTVLKAMKDIVRSKKTIILLKESNGAGFIPQATAGVRDLNVSIPQNHALIKHIEHSTGLLIKDELAMEKEQEQSTQHIAEIEEVEGTFNWLDIAVVLPLYVNKELTGFIALGDKLSGAPYMQDDINFLSALAPQAAVALKNARLYKESLEFSAKLEAEVTRATHELEIANEQLRDLDKAKSEFLSVASHQLYTPLTALRGYLSMIQEGEFGKTTVKQKPIINILEKSSNRLINLIKNLLDISRIESGRLELNLETTNIVQMTEELVKDLLPNALRKKIKFKMHTPAEPLPNVVADKERIRQVLLNIIDNAIKYTNKGRVNVSLEKNLDEIIISVTDTGRGMTQDEIAKIFTKFTRVGGDSRFRTEGSGLGLYVAKQIIREHHGGIEVTSPGLEKGSTFAIHFPIEGSPQSLQAGEQASVEIKAAETRTEKVSQP